MSDRSSEFVMTPSLVKKSCDRIEQESYQKARFLPSPDSPNDLQRTPAQEVNQQRNAVEALWSPRSALQPMARKVPIEVTRKVGGQARGKIAHQSVTGNLRQHPFEAVADRKFDTR